MVDRAFMGLGMVEDLTFAAAVAGWRPLGSRSGIAEAVGLRSNVASMPSDTMPASVL